MCQATNFQGPAKPSWKGMHKADIVLTQTLHQKKKFYSITMARLSPFSVMLYCCVHVLPGPKKSYLLPNRVKKKSQHNITCLVSWLWVRRCPLIYLPKLKETERNCFRKLSNENLRETEGDFTFSWFIPLSFWFFTKNMHYFAIIIKEGLEGMNSLHHFT